MKGKEMDVSALSALDPALKAALLIIAILVVVALSLLSIYGARRYAASRRPRKHRGGPKRRP